MKCFMNLRPIAQCAAKARSGAKDLAESFLSFAFSGANYDHR